MTEATGQHPSESYTARLVVSWAVVLIPLGYGLYNSAKAVAQLFTG